MATCSVNLFTKGLKRVQMTDGYCPRLSINITEEQQRKISRLFPWGTQKKVFGVIIDDLISLCETHGADKVIGAFMSRYIRLEEISRIELSRKKATDGND